MSNTGYYLKNGVDIDALLAVREALTDTPEAARFTWRARSQWVDGTHTKSTIEEFSGFGEDFGHQRRFQFDTDHPAAFAAGDNGATPVELILVALAGCLTGGIATIASNRGVRLHSVTATIQADMDIQGVLGIDGDVRNGCNAISVDYRIDADASPEDIAAIVAQSQRRSAVFDMLTNPSDVSVTVRS